MSESAALDKFLSRREEKPLLSSTSSYLTSNVRELDTVSIIQMAKSKFHHKTLTDQALRNWMEDYAINNPTSAAVLPNFEASEKDELESIVEMNIVSNPQYAWQMDDLNERTIQIDNFIEEDEEEDIGYIPTSIMKGSATTTPSKPSIHPTPIPTTEITIQDLEEEENEEYKQKEEYNEEGIIEDLIIEDEEEEDHDKESQSESESVNNELDWLRMLLTMSKTSSQHANLLSSLNYNTTTDWQAVSDIEPFVEEIS